MLNEIYHSINPVAFSFGPFEVRWYGLAYIFGFLLAGAIMASIARRWRLRLSGDDIFVLLVSVALGVIVGARLGYCLFYGNGYYFAHPIEIFYINQGGMSFHGGLVGAILGGYLSCRHNHYSFATMADLCAITAPWGLFFGRCANFINGELWGKPTDLPWGVIFETGGNVARHPSQLYEAFLEGIVLFCILIVLARKNPPRPQGTFIGTFMLFYGIFRFAIEFVRVPDEQIGYLFGFLTMGQLLSLPLIIAGIIILVVAKRENLPQIGILGVQQVGRVGEAPVSKHEITMPVQAVKAVTVDPTDSIESVSDTSEESSEEDTTVAE